MCDVCKSIKDRGEVPQSCYWEEMMQQVNALCEQIGAAPDKEKEVVYITGMFAIGASPVEVFDDD